MLSAVYNLFILRYQITLVGSPNVHIHDSETVSGVGRLFRPFRLVADRQLARAPDRMLKRKKAPRTDLHGCWLGQMMRTLRRDV